MSLIQSVTFPTLDLSGQHVGPECPCLKVEGHPPAPSWLLLHMCPAENFPFIIYSAPTPLSLSKLTGCALGRSESQFFLPGGGKDGGGRGVHPLGGAMLRSPGVSETVTSRLNQAYCWIQLLVD